MNELALSQNKSTLIWEDEQSLMEIKKVFAPKLSDMEFAFYVGMGKGLQLNPFLREIWAIKYDEKSPAQIFIGRDGYRINAARHPDYDWHTANAVYEKDIFSMKTTMEGTIIEHTQAVNSPGKLLGAYCMVKKKSCSNLFVQYVPFEEYSTGKSLWRDAKDGGKPSTMIKKVAEAQTIRLAFPDKFNGTYSEYEEISDSKPIVVNDAKSKLNSLMQKQKSPEQAPLTIEQPVNESNETGEVASQDQLKEIHALMAVKGMQNGRVAKALEHYGVEYLGQLTAAQANDFVAQLKKMDDI